MIHLTHILVVEDSDEDYEATERAFRKVGLNNPLHRCESGDEAIDFLKKEGRYAPPIEVPTPNLILLDLNLPGTDGREVLEVIKSDKNLKKVPVIVLTTSEDDKDIEECYYRGANSYIVKPVDFDGFIDAVQRLKDYWFEIVILPRG